ncbi:unnamed protein product, partial [Meganyctiphanes norvegica]
FVDTETEPTYHTRTATTETNPEDGMDTTVDGLMDKIGFGKWHILYFLSTCLTRACRAIQYINTVFVNRSTDEDTYQVQEHCEQSSPYLGSFVCGNTLSVEFENFGDEVWISALYQFIFVFGSMLGASLGTISDLFGRLLVIRLSALMYLVATVVISVFPNIYIVLIARFIIGFADNLICTTSQTLLTEVTPKKYVTSLGLLVFLAFAAAAMGLAGVAYFVRSWRSLHLICSIPVLLLAIVVLFLKESPRWLVTQGRFEEATDIIEDAATKNRSLVPRHDNLKSILATASESIIHLDRDKSTKKNSMANKIKSLFLSFYATPHMRRLSLIIPNLWVIINLVFFGLILNANNFTSNIYLYTFLTNAFSIIPTLIGSLLVKKIGNKASTILFFALTGLCLLGLQVLPEEFSMVAWVLTIIAFMTSSLCNDLNFVMTYELMPTVLRTTGSGISLLAGNVGILLASYLFGTVVHQVSWLPNAISALCCLIATGLLFLLPETYGQPLCETIEQVEERGNNKGKTLGSTKL